MALMALADLPEDDARGVTIRDGAKMRKFVVLRWKGETIVYRNRCPMQARRLIGFRIGSLIAAAHTSSAPPTVPALSRTPAYVSMAPALETCWIAANSL